MKWALLRPRAEADLSEATAYYAEAAGDVLAERMFDAAVAALQAIERMPSMGSPRFGEMCAVPGLRSWRVAGFPMQWLYMETHTHLDVIRLLGDRQDIIAILSTDG